MSNHGSCDWCSRPAELIRNRGEKVCAPCIDGDTRTNGIDILMRDTRGPIPAFTYNTVRDAGKVYPRNPYGTDGRDLPSQRARRKAARGKR
jgi:hypothetical protein